MDSSGPSAKAYDQPANHWSEIMGTLIAVLTLTLPVLAIANYSSTSVEALPRNSYSLPK